MRRLSALLLGVLLFSAASCGKSGEDPVPDPVGTYVKGADVSWLTQMEKEGCLFYDRNGSKTECLALLKQYEINAIRLRVWVNPKDGWCGKEDVVAKAKRARDLGMRVMIDFHYSDSWADPGKQNKPDAWKKHSFNDLKKALASHTTEVLTALKSAGVTPEWIQVGNETTGGMLWPDGQNYQDDGFTRYVQLHNAGYDAAKAVFPQAKVMVHVDNGWDEGLMDWFFESFNAKGGKYDLIGLSFYPEASSWQTRTQQICDNMKKLYSLYQKESLICELGMEWTQASACRNLISGLVQLTKDISNSHCQGVMYWEPEAYHAWSGYSKAAFDNQGKPTIALEGFIE